MRTALVGPLRSAIGALLLAAAVLSAVAWCTTVAVHFHDRYLMDRRPASSPPSASGSSGKRRSTPRSSAWALRGDPVHAPRAGRPSCRHPCSRATSSIGDRLLSLVGHGRMLGRRRGRGAAVQLRAGPSRSASARSFPSPINVGMLNAFEGRQDPALRSPAALGAPPDLAVRDDERAPGGRGVLTVLAVMTKFTGLWGLCRGWWLWRTDRRQARTFASSGLRSRRSCRSACSASGPGGRFLVDIFTLGAPDALSPRRFARPCPNLVGGASAAGRACGPDRH